MAKFYVVNEAAARTLGIIDAEGNSQEYDATLEQVSAAAEFSTDHCGAALAYVCSQDEDCWIIDESGDSDYYAWADRHGRRRTRIMHEQEKKDLKAEGFLEAIELIREMSERGKSAPVPPLALQRVEGFLVSVAEARGYIT